MEKRITAFIFLLSFLATTGVFAQSASTTVDFVGQRINAWGLAGTPWEKNVSLEEERSRAWMDALHHAYEAILDVSLMSGITVRNSINVNPALKERLGSILLSAEKTFFQPDLFGLVRCQVVVPFVGPSSLRSALYLAALRPRDIEPAGFVGSGSYGIVHASELGSSTIDLEFRRMVIDLRRTTFEPSLFPRFFAEDGRLLYQEGQVPGPHRFSRPVVRFSEKIEDAETDVKSSQVMYVAATVPLLSPQDIRILAPDANIFYRFCKKLEDEPTSKREVMIIFGKAVHAGGILPKPQARDKEKEKGPKAPKGRTKGRKP